MNDFAEENIPQSAWMKFDNVGDICKGTVVETFVKQWEGNFPAQTVYVLTNASRGTATIVEDKVTAPKLEEVWSLNVGSSKAFVNDRLKSTKVWDIIAFAFIKEIPSKTKWNANAKSVVPFKSWVDEEYLKSIAWDEITIEDNPF